MIVDASVVIKVLWEEEDSELAESLFERAGDRLMAPGLLGYEVTSAIRHAKKPFALADREAFLGIFHALPIRQVPGEAALARDALRLALERGISVYDATYVVLARRLRTSLVTADARLVRAMRDAHVVPLAADLPEDV